MEIMSDDKAREMFSFEILYIETVDLDDLLQQFYEEILEFTDMPLEEGSFDKLDYNQLNFVVSAH